MNKVLVIVGPTGVGKTSFSIDLAKTYNSEIISGDSIQIYKGLDIGSGKIKEEEKQGIIHHLINIKEANENYSVKEFQELGRKKIEDIIKENKLPIVVGGTGLYIKALLYDYTFFDEDKEDDQFINMSNIEIYKEIEKKDPKALLNTHVNNRKRLVRALNILKKHNTGISSIKDKQNHKPIYDIKIIGLTKEKEELINLVDKRIDEMINDGLIDEIKELLNKGITFNNQSMQGIGYKEFKGYFDNTKSLDECIKDVKTHTHQFIKRQYTWFKNQMNVEWYTDINKAKESIKKWYE